MRCTSISCTVFIWIHEDSTANNRESTRIAFSLRCLLVLVVSLLGRVPTLRLIGSAWPERQRGKCWKTRVAGFLFIRDIFLLAEKRIQFHEYWCG